MDPPPSSSSMSDDEEEEQDRRNEEADTFNDEPSYAGVLVGGASISSEEEKVSDSVIFAEYSDVLSPLPGAAAVASATPTFRSANNYYPKKKYQQALPTTKEIPKEKEDYVEFVYEESEDSGSDPVKAKLASEKSSLSSSTATTITSVPPVKVKERSFDPPASHHTMEDASSTVMLKDSSLIMEKDPSVIMESKPASFIHGKNEESAPPATLVRFSGGKKGTGGGGGGSVVEVEEEGTFNPSTIATRSFIDDPQNSGKRQYGDGGAAAPQESSLEAGNNNNAGGPPPAAAATAGGGGSGGGVVFGDTITGSKLRKKRSRSKMWIILAASLCLLLVIGIVLGILFGSDAIGGSSSSSSQSNSRGGPTTVSLPTPRASPTSAPTASPADKVTDKPTATKPSLTTFSPVSPTPATSPPETAAPTGLPDLPTGTTANPTASPTGAATLSPKPPYGNPPTPNPTQRPTPMPTAAPVRQTDVPVTQHPTPPMSIRFLEAREVVVDNQISLADDVMDPVSPQFQALQWIADEDGQTYRIPSSPNDNGYLDFVERYVASILYYSLDEMDMPETFRSIMSDRAKRDICDWHASDDMLIDCQGYDGIFFGFGCDDGQFSWGRVTRVFLPCGGISGMLASEIRELGHLFWLQVPGNMLTGLPVVFPNGSRRLPNGLRRLNLSNNRLSGPLPDYLFTVNRIFAEIFLDGNEDLSYTGVGNLCKNYGRSTVIYVNCRTLYCHRVDCPCCKERDGTQCEGMQFPCEEVPPLVDTSP